MQDECRPQKIAVIVNPNAGGGKAGRRLPELQRLMEKEAGTGVTWEVVTTSARGHAVELARQAAANGCDIVAAAGGDGTYGEVVNGIIGSGARLGIVPFGTGNDFARALGIGTNLDISIHTLFHGIERAIDLGSSGERYFINVAACGFDAAVADRFNRTFRFLHGAPAYVLAVLASIVTYQSRPITLILDGNPRLVCAMLCTIANAPTYGGGMRIAPDAKIDDGLFDVCLLHKVNKFEFLASFYKVFKGTHIHHPRVEMLRAARVRIESEWMLPVMIDGDAVGKTPVEFQLHPRAIKVLVPEITS